jgi:hypothetical protein
MTEALDDHTLQTPHAGLQTASPADSSLRWIADRLHRRDQPFPLDQEALHRPGRPAAHTRDRP